MCYIVGFLFQNISVIDNFPQILEKSQRLKVRQQWYWLSKSAIEVRFHIVRQLGSLHEKLWNCCRYTGKKATGINRAPHSRLSHFCHQVRAVLLQLPTAREGRDPPVVFAECQYTYTTSRTFETAVHKHSTTAGSHKCMLNGYLSLVDTSNVEGIVYLYIYWPLVPFTRPRIHQFFDEIEV